MKADHDGSAILAFQDERSGHLDIVVYKIDKNGNQQWGASGITLTDQSATQGLAPTIGVLGNNDVIIAWTPNDGSINWVDFQKITSNGNFGWPTIKQIIDLTGTKRYTCPTMVPSGNDEFKMLYGEQTGSALAPCKLLAQYYDVNGAPVWLNPVTVSTYTISAFYRPVAISDKQGGFYVGFNTSAPSFPGFGLEYLQHVSTTGNIWNSIGVPASQLPNNQQYTPATLFDSTNNVIYVLLKITDTGQTQSGVYVQKLDTSGTVLWNVNAVELVPIQATYNDPWTFSLTPTGVIATFTTGTAPSQVLNSVKVDSVGNILWNGLPVSLCSLISGKEDEA